MTGRWAELQRLGRFALVGVANTLLDVGVYTALLYGLRVSPYLAQGVGYSCGVLNSYICNRRWTFGVQSRFFGATLVRFLLVNLAMLGLSTGLLWFSLEEMALGRMPAKILVTLCSLGINFVLSRWWVFRG